MCGIFGKIGDLLCGLCAFYAVITPVAFASGGEIGRNSSGQVLISVTIPERIEIARNESQIAPPRSDLVRSNLAITPNYSGQYRVARFDGVSIVSQKSHRFSSSRGGSAVTYVIVPE